METTDIEWIRAYVHEVLGPSGSHGLDHIERVTAMCERIGRIEHADMAVLIPAALLHDIARPLEAAQGIPHEQEGARMAELFLTALPYPAGTIPAIAHAIRAHRFRSTETPATLEARILSDADKLDAMGAVGIARTFMRAGEHQGTLDDAVHHFHEFTQVHTGHTNHKIDSGFFQPIKNCLAAVHGIFSLDNIFFQFSTYFLIYFFIIPLLFFNP